MFHPGSFLNKENGDRKETSTHAFSHKDHPHALSVLLFACFISYTPYTTGLERFFSVLMTDNGTTCDVRGFVLDFFPTTSTSIFPAEPSYSTCSDMALRSATSCTHVLSRPAVAIASIAKMFEFCFTDRHALHRIHTRTNDSKRQLL